MKLEGNQITLSPSDLVNHTGCKHLTEQKRQVALGNREKPDWNDPALAILQKKGIEHEEAYLKSLEDKKLSIINLEDKGVKDTIDAMQKGYDVIYQARLANDRWYGIADFLIKKEGKSNLGDYHYEIEDTKLAQETKSGTVLQLCLYADILNEIQGRKPTYLKVVKPGDNFPKGVYRLSDFEAYYRLTKAQLEATIDAGPQKTYPNPVDKCNTCQYWKECNATWHLDDHLSLVAGLRNGHRKVIEAENVKTLKKFADKEKPLDGRPDQGSIQTFEKLHSQAKVQLKGRVENKLIHELLPVEDQRGLNRLPTPSTKDIYFDIEGDHFYKEGGLEYLLGVVYKDEKGNLKYNSEWNENRSGEKESFINLMQLILKKWEEDPNMHIYHYGHYEASAIKRLASRHAVMEKEVDDLLRAHKFVDLHSVIKESLQASVEGYSLKDLEKFAGFERATDLRAASAARRSYSSALELNKVENLDKDIKPLIEAYNKDDCIATEALHRWLEEIFQHAQKTLSITRPQYEEQEASDNVKDRDKKALELFNCLTMSISPDRDDRSNEEHAKWLLAHMVAYHRREERSKAWEFHHLHDMEQEELLYERKAISYMKYDKDVSDGKSTLHRYVFPNQEISLKKGDSLKEIQGDKVGSVIQISKESIVIRKSKKSVEIHPDAVIEDNYINPTVLENALHDLADDIIKNGLEDPGVYSVGKQILINNAPSFNTQTGNLRQDGEKLVDAGIRLAEDLNNSFLPIQGPPGTGKSFTGAHMILDLVQKGKKVGITAVGHSVIRGLIDKVLDLAQEQKIKIECVHKTSKKNERDGLTFQGDNGRAIKALDDGKVVGGTAYLWARPEAIDCLDYLFIDEAGQMSLAYVLAISRSAKNVVLLGDPQQLEQPQKGAHPEGADVSALEHILNGHKTMPPDKGLFLDVTWRLNPDICAFTSEVYYENRLQPQKDTHKQILISNTAFNGSGLFYVSLQHEGNRNKASEEVNKIEQIVAELIMSETTWIDRQGHEQVLIDEDILIVAPYNAQVNALQEKLPHLRIGTVDKFQGQEAPVVIYSMASSSPEEAPRGMSFLYDPNRLNVATSRAQCICILVASPKLIEPECHTIDQMNWANGLCRYVELAKEIQ